MLESFKNGSSLQLKYHTKEINFDKKKGKKEIKVIVILWWIVVMGVDFKVELMATEGCLTSREGKPEKKPLVCLKKDF